MICIAVRTRVCFFSVALLAVALPRPLDAQVPTIGAFRNQMGQLSQQISQNQFAEAAQTAKQLQVTAEQLMGPANPDVIRMGLQRGILLRSAGQYDESLSQLNTTLQHATQRLGARHVIVGETHNTVGSVLRLQGKFDQAGSEYRKSIGKLKALGPAAEKQLAEACSNYCDLLAANGQYLEALQYGNQSLEINRRLFGDQNNATLTSLNNVAMAKIKLGKWDDAETDLRQAMKTSEQLFGTEHPETAIVLNNLGLLFSLRTGYRESVGYYQRALEINQNALGDDHPTTAKVGSNLGQILCDMGRSSEAIEYLRPALKAQQSHFGQDHPSVAMTKHNLGCALMNVGINTGIDDEVLSQARELMTESATYFEQHVEEQSSLAAGSRAFLGGLESIQGNAALAIEHFDQSRRSSILAAWRLLPKMSSNEQYLFMNRRLNWTLYAALSLAYDFPRSQDVAQATATWLANGKAIATDALVMSRRTKLTARSISVPEIVSIEDIRRNLADGAVLIDMVRQDRIDLRKTSYEERVGAPRYVVWVSPKQGDIVRVDLGDADQIDQLIGEARRLIATQDVDALRKSLDVLSQRIWIPLADRLPDDTQHLWLSPDSSLWLVPWSALPSRDGTLLTQSYSHATLSSGRELVADQAGRPSKSSSSATFANPDFDLPLKEKQKAHQAVFRGVPTHFTKAVGWNIVDRSQLHAGPLPGTAAECEAIMPVLRKWLGAETVAYQGRYALESVAKKMVSPRVVVFATHGFFIDEQSSVFDPLQRCGLILSGFNDLNSIVGNDDGVLTGTEIAEINLAGTELVVLSACDTGVGRIEHGNGVAGLRRAFELAGCRSVVSTLWSIPDQGTVDLMKEFFRQLAKGESKAKALQNAQLNRIKDLEEQGDYAHPMQWAGFTLSGGE